MKYKPRAGDLYRIRSGYGSRHSARIISTANHRVMWIIKREGEPPEIRCEGRGYFLRLRSNSLRSDRVVFHPAPR